MDNLTEAFDKGEALEHDDIDVEFDNAADRDEDETSDIGGRYQEIQDAHVDDGTALRAEEAFTKLKRQALAPKLEGRGMLICGPSGAGKSHAWKRLTIGPEFMPRETDEGLVRPLLRLSAPAPCTLKTLGREIYRKLTDIEMRSSIQEHEIWSRVRAHLKAQKVKYLFIDEMHHVLIGRNLEEQRKVAETFKTLMQMEEWPIYLVLAGMPESLPFIRQNRQLDRRIRKIKIAPVAPGAVGDKAIRRHMDLLIPRLGIEVDFDLDDIATRLHVASGGYLGICALYLKEATSIAFDAETNQVTTEDLAEALVNVFAEDGKEIDDDANPFLCSDLSKAYRPDTGDAGRKTALKAIGPSASARKQK